MSDFDIADVIEELRARGVTGNLIFAPPKGNFRGGVGLERGENRMAVELPAKCDAMALDKIAAALKQRDRVT